MDQFAQHGYGWRWVALLLLIPLLAGLSFGLVLLHMARTGSGSSDTITPATQITPTATAVPLGLSRSNPHPPGSTVSLANWDVTLLESPIRGPEAWALLKEANMFNEPPSAGQEYLLLHLSIVHKGTTTEENSLGLHVTGSANVVHHSFDNWQVPPAPILRSHLSGPDQSAGWEAYTIAAGERNLILMVDDLFNFAEPVQYLALTAESPPPIPAAELANVRPTSLGAAPDDPAAVGNIVTSANWQMQVLEVVRGEAAWQLALATNRFNDPPPAGFEYVLVRARVRYLGLAEGPHSINHYSHFATLDGDGQVYTRPSLVVPTPQLYGWLFPGGEITGWLAAQVSVADPTPLLRFSPGAAVDPATEIRYFWLRADGR